MENNNKIKYTPGPWRYTINKDGSLPHLIKDINGGQFPIAQVFLNAPQTESEANAKLISASPELLDAIKYYFDVLKEVRGEDWDKSPDHVLSKMLNAYKKTSE